MNKAIEILKKTSWQDIALSIVSVFVLSPIAILFMKILFAAIKWSWNIEVNFDE